MSSMLVYLAQFKSTFSLIPGDPVNDIMAHSRIKIK